MWLWKYCSKSNIWKVVVSLLCLLLVPHRFLIFWHLTRSFSCKHLDFSDVCSTSFLSTWYLYGLSQQRITFTAVSPSLDADARTFRTSVTPVNVRMAGRAWSKQSSDTVVSVRMDSRDITVRWMKVNKRKEKREWNRSTRVNVGWLIYIDEMDTDCLYVFHGACIDSFLYTYNTSVHS